MTLGEILFLSGAVATFAVFGLTLGAVTWLEARPAPPNPSRRGTEAVNHVPDIGHPA